MERDRPAGGACASLSILAGLGSVVESASPETARLRARSMVELRDGRCPRCNREFWICRSCDHGHVYCGRWCAGEARRESLRKARRKHRRSAEGKADHRDRERERRARRRELATIADRRGVARSDCVGDQGSMSDHLAAKIAAMSPTTVFNPGFHLRLSMPRARLRVCCVCGRKSPEARPC